LYHTEEDMKAWDEYLNAGNSTLKWMLTVNWKLINEAWKEKIHFNVNKLEAVIWYESDNKSPIEIYKIIDHEDFEITEKLLPEKLEIFLWLKEQSRIIHHNTDVRVEDLPF
jgi:intein-encoded DNA endonuclease-like protein